MRHPGRRVAAVMVAVVVLMRGDVTVGAQDEPEGGSGLFRESSTPFRSIEMTRQTDAARPVPPGGASHTWQIAVHVGTASMRTSTQGSARLPVMVTRVLPGVNTTVPLVTSWYIGDGAALLNDAMATLGYTLRMTALDPVLTHVGTERDRGLALGFRVSRAFNSRFGAEFGLDASLVSVRLTDDARGGIEASRVSFERTFGGYPGATAGSNASIDQGDGGWLNATGAVNVNVLTSRRVTPYLTVGGGIGRSLGVVPNVTLVGRYQAPLAGGAILDVTDTVTIRYEEKVAPVFLLGGGFMFELTRRVGISGDIRFGLRPNTGRIAVDAVRSDKGAPFATFAGPPVSDFETFTGGGLDVQTTVTVGYFTRF